MHYNLLKKISRVRNSPRTFKSHVLYIDKKSKKLFALNKVTLDISWSTPNRVYSCDIVDNYIIASCLAIYNFNGSLVYSHEDSDLYDYEKIYLGSKTIWKKVDEIKNEVFYCIFDVQKKIFIEQNINVQDLPVILLNKQLITRGMQGIICYETKNFTKAWQFDISILGTYKEKKIFAEKEPEEKQREIKRVYFKEGKIIASLSRAIIAIAPETGELLWKIDFEGYNPIDIVFDGNIGYIGERLYYAVIDIEEGVRIFESEFDHDIDIAGDKISWVNSGSGLVLHNEFLWCVFNENNSCYLVKLNPANGKLVDGMKLETIAPSTKPPVFDENRLYILDQDGVLFIYEEQ